MEIKDYLSAAVLKVLDKDNYVAWSVQVKTYLMVQDLWEIVEATTEPPKQEDDEATFKEWSDKNSMALNVIQVSCGPDAMSLIRQISLAKIAWNTLAVVFQVLEKDNYVDWSVRVKFYLMAHDLWDIIEGTTEPPRQEDDEAAFKAWTKKNSIALHIIQISCGPNIFSVIIQTSSAKVAWDTLAEKFLQVLEEDNYVEWSVRVKSYLMAHDLWDIIEGTIEPPRQEDDEAAFKAWSKKNSMALHVIQISCEPDRFSVIIQTSSAKVAWDKLAEKFLQVLEKDNYVEWSVRVKSYLMAHDLWDIIEGTTEHPRKEDDEAAFKAWSKKNSRALYVIQISCGLNRYLNIEEISSAKIAWHTLGEKCVTVLEEEKYEVWSVWVRSYLMAHDLWDIIERTTNPPKQENDETAFKAWSKKNSMALHVLQVSCGPDALFVIRQISSAKIAWNTLAKKYISGNQNYNLNQYQALIKAVGDGDWNAVEEFLMLNPNATSGQITYLGETALHVAVEAGHVDIVEKLVDVMSEEDLAIQDCYGMTALVGAINAGNYMMTHCMCTKNYNLLSIKNSNEQIPLIQAIFNGHIELARYLYLFTPREYLTPERGGNGATLFTQAIYTRSLDIALHLLQKLPRLALALDYQGLSPFYALAAMPHAFPSGDRLVFWKRWIYSGIHIQLGSAFEEICLNIQNAENRQSDHVIKIIGLVKSFLRHPVPYLLDVLGMKHLYEMKLAHVKSRELLTHMLKEISISNYEQRKRGCVYSAIVVAIKKGNIEFVFDVVTANPDLLRGTDERRTIFEAAVQYRQPQIFSFIYSLDVKRAFTYSVDEKGNHILHIAGIPADSTILNRIQGPALQMQKELQWFKAVENIVPPKFKEAFNNKFLTPRELFTKEHKEMRKAGEEWMKSTATSCTTVAALIVTIMFAAAFTVPGGNDQNSGFPIFLDKKLFMLFIVSDALSLFSSSASLLMFLSIFTSRYEEDDFLKSLPRKIIIGLFTLFFSITTMMIAFSAALLIMLHGQLGIVIPVVCLASLPVTLFVLMHFSLFAEMFISTYRRGIFNKKMERWV